MSDEELEGTTSKIFFMSVILENKLDDVNAKIDETNML
jgi:hypothetical protein